jgi:hypothetical protein
MVTGDHEFVQWSQRIIHGEALLANVSTGSLLQHPWGLFLIFSTPSPTAILKWVSFVQAFRNCFRYKLTHYVRGTEGASSSADDINCYIIRKLLRILFSTNEYFWYARASANFRHAYK